MVLCPAGREEMEAGEATVGVKEPALIWQEQPESPKEGTCLFRSLSFPTAKQG